MNARRTPRRGAVLFLAVACIALLALVFGSLLRLGSAGRVQARAEERRLRAAWLAESGLERAWAKLASSPAYRGETWELSSDTLRGRDGAVVEIKIEARNDHLRVTSRADYPREGTARARQTRTASFPIPTSTEPRSGATP